MLPSENLSTMDNSFRNTTLNTAMNKCHRYLNIVRTPTEIRKMSSTEVRNLNSQYADETSDNVDEGDRNENLGPQSESAILNFVVIIIGWILWL